MSKATILIIDDDKAVLEVMAMILNDAGFKTKTFMSAKEGVAYYQQHHPHIDACIVDMSMLDMNGIQCSQAMRTANPEATIILSSGHTLDDIERTYGAIQVQGFLKKPYLPKMLVETVKNSIPAPLAS